jgi:hypothetical protein
MSMALDGYGWNERTASITRCWSLVVNDVKNGSLTS